MKFFRLLGITIAALLLLAGAILVAVIVWKLAADMNGQLAAALVTFVGTVSLAVWNFQRTKERESEARLFPEKAKVYAAILETIKLLVSPEEIIKNKPTQNSIVRKLLDAKFDLIIWGSPASLRAIDCLSEENLHEGDMFAKMAYLLGCMRRDLGHKLDYEDCEWMVLYMIKTDDKPKTQALIRQSVFFNNVVMKEFPQISRKK